MERSEIVSKCLDCKHFSGKPQYMAKRNNGMKAVNNRAHNWCYKHDVDLVLIEKDGKQVPDIAECKSFEQK